MYSLFEKAPKSVFFANRKLIGAALLRARNFCDPCSSKVFQSLLVVLYVIFLRGYLFVLIDVEINSVLSLRTLYVHSTHILRGKEQGRKKKHDFFFRHVDSSTLTRHFIIKKLSNDKSKRRFGKKRQKRIQAVFQKNLY